eukprot:Tamp_10739.p1 GENE.Tamp_10739~~Tamp_10739.p1  ORF type:complete len:250 (+),score=36.43 Tamp_10739:1174-1923(+)
MGRSALFLAVHHKQRAVVELLLHRQANPAVADHRGRTPLHVAAQRDAAEMAAVLFAYDAPLDVVDLKGRTCLHYAAECCSTAVTSDIVNLPAARGREIVDIQDGYKRSALHAAAQMGDVTVVKLLLRSEADVNLQEQKGHTPLDVARYFGNAAAAEVLTVRGGIANKTVPGMLDLARHAAAVKNACGTADYGSGKLREEGHDDDGTAVQGISRAASGLISRTASARTVSPRTASPRTTSGVSSPKTTKS